MYVYKCYTKYIRISIAKYKEFNLKMDKGPKQTFFLRFPKYLQI